MNFIEGNMAASQKDLKQPNNQSEEQIIISKEILIQFTEMVVHIYHAEKDNIKDVAFMLRNNFLKYLSHLLLNPVQDGESIKGIIITQIKILIDRGKFENPSIAKAVHAAIEHDTQLIKSLIPISDRADLIVAMREVAAQSSTQPIAPQVLPKMEAYLTVNEIKNIPNPNAEIIEKTKNLITKSKECFKVGYFVSAITCIKIAIIMLRPIYSELTRDERFVVLDYILALATALHAYGMDRHSKGDFEEAIRQFNSAINILDAVAKKSGLANKQDLLTYRQSLAHSLGSFGKTRREQKQLDLSCKSFKAALSVLFQMSPEVIAEHKHEEAHQRNLQIMRHNLLISIYKNILAFFVAYKRLNHDSLLKIIDAIHIFKFISPILSPEQKRNLLPDQKDIASALTLHALDCFNRGDTIESLKSYKAVADILIPVLSSLDRKHQSLLQDARDKLRELVQRHRATTHTNEEKIVGTGYKEAAEILNALEKRTAAQRRDLLLFGSPKPNNTPKAANLTASAKVYDSKTTIGHK